MVDLQPSRRTVLTVGVAAIVGGGGAYLLEGGADPETPDCQRSPPVGLDAPTIGGAGIPTPIASYTDFSCPHCKDHALNVLPKIRNRYLQSEQVSYLHYDFPLPVDKWSRPAASAAREVQRRADDAAFFDYSKKLYQNQDNLSYGLFGNLADSVGVDGGRVETAARESRYCALLNESINQGLDRGVQGTPTVFVGDQKLTSPSISDVDDAIQKVQSNGTANSTTS
jgi:protein-disulfide isomerase